LVKCARKAGRVVTSCRERGDRTSLVVERLLEHGPGRVEILHGAIRTSVP